MWTLLKPFIEERPANYRIYPVCTMVNRESAIFRNFLSHTLYFINSGVSVTLPITSPCNISSSIAMVNPSARLNIHP